MKKKILAFVLTMLLVCQLGVVALAEDVTETVVVAADNGTPTASETVNHDVSTNNIDGVDVTSKAKGSDAATTTTAEATVKGDTEKADATVTVTNGPESEATDVDGLHVYAYAAYGSSNETKSTANGTVVGDIEVNNSSETTEADGIDLVTKAGYGNATAIATVKHGDVTVTNGDGIDVTVKTMDNSAKSIADAEVYVYGDVTAKESGNGINVTTSSAGTKSDLTAVIVVDGTVTGVNAAVNVNGNVVPTIIVGELVCTTGDANLVTVGEGSSITQDDVVNNISYILSTGENINVIGGHETNTYKNGDIVTLQIPDGYELVNGSVCKRATATDLGNGIYQVTVVTGGGLTFTARVKYVPAAYTTTTSVTTNSMKGNKTDGTQPIMVVNMKASHFQKVMVDGTDLAESNFVVGAKENGLLTFQFSTSYIKSLAAGTYSLQFVTTENVTYTMKLVMAEDGTYTVSF